MSKQEDQNQWGSKTGILNRLLLGGELGPLTDRQAYEQRVNALPPEQREFAEESSRFADIWQYFSERRIQLPRDVVDQVNGLAKLSAAEQIAVMRRVNQALMVYLNDVSEDSGVRQ